MSNLKVTVLPWNLVIRASENETLLNSLRKANIPIRSDCGGKGHCGKCVVKVLEPVGIKEGTNTCGLKEDEVLSCLFPVSRDLKIYVPASAIETHFVKDKCESNRQVSLDPAVKRYTLNPRIQGMIETKEGIEIILFELENSYGLKGIEIDEHLLSVVKDFPTDNLEIFVWEGREVIDLRPAGEKGLYGVAIDIGTSVIAAYLSSLDDGSIIASSSILNPQITFGQDIISRLHYVKRNGEKGLKEIRQALILGLNALIEDLTRKAKVRNSEILDIVVVGNTLMHHFFLGLDPDPLTHPPFRPVLSNPIDVKARDLGLNVGIGTYVHVLPLVGGFVGADTVANIISVFDETEKSDCMIVDVGTNGEIVVKKGKDLYAASCATGPAFEGMNLSSGMRADLGAIESVRINRHDLSTEYRVIGNIKPKGICGSGIVDTVSQLYVTGIIDSSGRIRSDISSERIRKRENTWEFVVAFSEETLDRREIVVTQKDIRAVQLGKAAIYAAAKTLLKESCASYDLPVILSGSFGSFLNPKNAYLLGMFPTSDPEKIVPRGNLSGYGAVLTLLSRRKRLQAKDLARTVNYLELSKNKNFRAEFFDALYIPHRKDDFLLKNLDRLIL